MHRVIVALFVLTAFCQLTFGQSAQSTSSPIDVSYTRSGILWSVFVPSTGCVLTVSGPEGFYWMQEYAPNSRPWFGIVDEQGVPRLEGPYRWEVVAQLPLMSGEPNPVVSGAFVISGGTILPKADDAQPAMIEDGAPVHSLFLDRAGRLGMGTSVPESQLHLKGSNPAITLQDTTIGGAAFTLRGLEKGDGSLGLFDRAGQARWFVDSEGRVGINTTKPTSTLTVDGYIEATKGFLVNGRPVGGTGFGLIGGSQPLWEGPSNTWYGTNSGNGTMTGSYNSFFGVDSGSSTTSGAGNTFTGWGAGKSNASGNDNSFFGAGAGLSNTASNNSFFGQNAGNQTTTGSYNSFFGQAAGRANVTGSDNSFFGVWAGRDNISNQNSFFGAYAGMDNTTGGSNSFFGAGAGSLNTTGYSNSVFGAQAGGWFGSENCFFGDYSGNVNSGGSDNAFVGHYAGQRNLTGSDNAFIGAYAGENNQSGYDNAFLGREAGHTNTTGFQNSFVGRSAGYANTVETGNTFVGYRADFNPGSNPSTNPVTNATAIGNRAYVAQSNSLILGSIPGVNSGTSYVNVGIGTTTPVYAFHLVRTGVNSAVVAERTDGAINYMNATATFGNFGTVNNYPLRLMVNGTWRMRLDSDNSLTMVNGATCTAGGVWTNSSSRELKENISGLSSEEAVRTLDGLNPVKFNYKADESETYVGFIAEDVPDLVATKDRKSLSPMDIVAVLTRVVQEQQRAAQDQQRMINQQQAELLSLKAEVRTLKGLVREK